MNAEGKKTAEDVEAEINHIRARMDATLDEIEHRLTPSALVWESLTSLFHIAEGRYFRPLVGVARRHPLPAAISGIALAGLLVARRRYFGSRLEEEQASEGRLARAIDSAREMLRESKDTFGDKVDASTAKLSRASSHGIARAREVATQARNQLRQVSGSAHSLVRERPIAVGAAALTIGIATLAVCLSYIRGKP